MRPILGLLALAACGPPCPVGLERVDGRCVPTGTTEFEPVELDEHGHPPCELLAPGPRLDLVNGCADGACDGASYEDVADALGSPGTCDGSDAIAETSFCDWQSGAVRSHFDDQDLDGEPDPGSTAQGIYLSPPWSGSDADGLGLGVSLACFYDVLGEPDETDRVMDGDLERVVGLEYFGETGVGTVFVDDLDLVEDPDGIVSSLSLFAP